MKTTGFRQFFDRFNHGLWPYAIIIGHTLLGTALVYSTPRSSLAFLALVSSFFSLYYFKADTPVQDHRRRPAGPGGHPGGRGPQHLLSRGIFQICVFAALALGLNIVVGFAGLLDLGYVAFYAVGAYLWAFFGSQQFYVLHFAPGTQPSNLPFLLPGDAFYLFMFLAIIVAAITGILLGLPVLRLRGDYLAIVTLGFGEVIRVLANNLDNR